MTVTLPSPRELVGVLLRDPQQLAVTDRTMLDHLRRDAMVAQAHDFAQAFLAMVRQRCPAQLDGWIHACAAGGVPELHNFASGLRREEAAIRAALSTPWSTGPVEGHITRLKCIKRQLVRRVTHRSIAPAGSLDKEGHRGVICITLRRKTTGKTALQKSGRRRRQCVPAFRKTRTIW